VRTFDAQTGVAICDASVVVGGMATSPGADGVSCYYVSQQTFNTGETYTVRVDKPMYLSVSTVGSYSGDPFAEVIIKLLHQ
jgi:hypothetical protein